MGLSIANLSVRVKATADDFNKTMASARETIEHFEQSAMRMGQSLRRVGTVMTGMGAVGAFAMHKLTNAAGEVSEGFREVDTLLDQSRDATEEFSGVVRRLSEEYAIQGGQVEAIQGLYQTLSAQVADTAAEAEEFLSVAVELSTVGLTDLDETVELLSLSLNTFGMEASDAAETADTLFTIVELGQLKFEDLAGSFATILPFAAELGVTFEETAAGMALMSRQFKSARRAAFGIRSSLQQLIRPSNALKDAFKEIVVELDAMDESTAQFHRQMVAEQEELSRLQAELTETEQALQSLRDQHDDYSDSMRENRIEIMEVRLQARKQGRELTAEEERHIERLQTKNDEYRVQQMKMESDIESTKDTQQAQTEAVDEQEGVVTEMEEQWDNMADTFGGMIVESEGLLGAFQAIQDYGERTNQPITSLISNQRALQFILPLLKEEGHEFSEALDAMHESTGKVNDEMAQFQESMGSRKQRAMNRLKNLAADIGQSFVRALIPAIENATDLIERLADWWNGLDQQLRDNIATFIALSTAILLILGPAFMFIGTLMIMGTLLGTAIIPLILGAAAVAAILYDVFEDLAAGGERADNRIDGMAQTLSNLHQFLKDLVSIFREELLPGLVALGEGVRSWIDAAVSAFQDLSDEETTLIDHIRTLASAIGDLFTKIGEWMQRNDDVIYTIVTIAGTIAQKLIPALVELGKGGIEVIKGIVGGFLDMYEAIAATQEEGGLAGDVFWGIIDAIANMITVLGKFLQEHGEVIGKLIAFIAVGVVVAKVVLGIAAGITALAGAASGAAATVAGMGSVMAVLKAVIVALGGPITVLIVLITVLVAIIATDFMGIRTKIVNVVKGSIDALQRLVDWFTDIPGRIRKALGRAVDAVKNTFERFKMWFSLIGGLFLLMTGPLGQFIVAWRNNWFGIRNFTRRVVSKIRNILGGISSGVNSLLKPVAKSVRYLIDYVIALKDAWVREIDKMRKGVRRSANRILRPIKRAIWDVMDWLRGIYDWFYNWGANIVDEMKRGIRNAAPNVGRAVKGVASRIEDKIGIFSDAEEGPLSNLTNWGPNIVKTLAQGVQENLGRLESTMNDIPGVGTEVNQEISGMSGVGGGVTIQSGAVSIEPGAFQGVAEEDIPEEVADEIEKKLDDLVRRMRSKGQTR